MRSIQVSEITANIKEMCIEANHFLTPDMKQALMEAGQEEKSELGKIILSQLEQNLEMPGRI